MNTTIELTQEQEKAIALKLHLGEEVFAVETEGGAKIFEGNEEEAREQFREDIEGTEEAEIEANFLIFCGNNFTEVEPYNEDDYSNDYLVLTDEEADEKWDEELDNYIEECIKPEIDKIEVGNLSSYIKFDEEAWKRDARFDGRGHAISRYDGNENEETVNGTTYYIYRQN